VERQRIVAREDSGPSSENIHIRGIGRAQVDWRNHYCRDSGEAIWSLIVSVMNNLIVPWLGDVVGQSSGLPPSFTRWPYNYPDLFVSTLEVCIAGIMAVILNYFFQRQRAGSHLPRSLC
jgi:hypothetical protein